MPAHDREHKAHRLRSIADLVEREGLAKAAEKAFSDLDPGLVAVIAPYFEIDEHTIVSRLRRAADDVQKAAGTCLPAGSTETPVA